MSVHSMKVNPQDNKLYVGGWFSKINNVQVSGLAKFDGNSFSQISNAIPPFVADTNSIYASAVYGIDFFNNNIYVRGNLFGIMENYQINKCLGYFNGIDWLGIPQIKHTDQSSIFVDSNRIFFNNYVAGVPYTNYYKPFTYIMDQLGNIDSLCFPYPLSSGTTFSNIITTTKYKGKYYFGGNVNGYDSIAISEDFFEWDGGSELTVVDGGIRGGTSYINAFAHYNDELYLGGYWLQADGNLSNTIMKYDGITLKPVFGFGTQNYITSMIVHNNILYMCGNFNDVNGIHDINNIVYYDGNDFKYLDTLDFDNTIATIEFYNNELYVGGGFWTIGNDSVSRIAKYTGVLPTGSKKIKEVFSIVKIYIDPLSQILNITTSTNFNETKIFNLQGQLVIAHTFVKQVDVSYLQSGMYVIELKNDKEKVWEKFVKE